MPPLADRARRSLPAGLASLAGLACAACCAIPLLLAGGGLSGAGWAAAGAWIPGIAAVLAALAGLAWWQARRRRRHRGSCAGGTGCACGGLLNPGPGSTSGQETSLFGTSWLGSGQMNSNEFAGHAGRLHAREADRA